MKSLFPGYYRPTQAEIEARFKDCLFCFDTNVLLNLYRFTPTSSKNLLAVLQHDKIKDRVWLPHQVGYEYHKNRVEVIIAQRELFRSLRKATDEAIGLYTKYRRSGNFHVNAVTGPIQKALEQVKSDLEKQKAEHPDLLEADPILDALTDLFDGKVGSEYPPEEHKRSLVLRRRVSRPSARRGFLTGQEGRRRKAMGNTGTCWSGSS